LSAKSILFRNKSVAMSVQQTDGLSTYDVSHGRGARESVTWKSRTVAAKKPLDLDTETAERGMVHEAQSDFVELRDGSGHGGTRALLRADENDSRVESEGYCVEDLQIFMANFKNGHDLNLCKYRNCARWP
jgi:hypothetical protein